MRYIFITEAQLLYLNIAVDTMCAVERYATQDRLDELWIRMVKSILMLELNPLGYRWIVRDLPK